MSPSLLDSLIIDITFYVLFLIIMMIVTFGLFNHLYFKQHSWQIEPTPMIKKMAMYSSYSFCAVMTMNLFERILYSFYPHFVIYFVSALLPFSGIFESFGYYIYF